MWVSRISRIGAQAIKKFAQGQLTYTQRTRYMHSSFSRIQTLLQPPQQRPRYRCTTSAANSSKDENGEVHAINVTFVETDGTEVQTKVPVGTNLLEAALSNDIELEGACEGSCACSTCHLIVMVHQWWLWIREKEKRSRNDWCFGTVAESVGSGWWSKRR
ncbi:unnamed protein product [Amaranthus hypochondriacus]